MKKEFNYSKRPSNGWDYLPPICFSVLIIFCIISIPMVMNDSKKAANPTITPQEINEAKKPTTTTEPTEGKLGVTIKSEKQWKTQ